MGFCQRRCNRVFQPLFQLRGVGIYSHGCKQGCFQPCRPGGSGPGWRSGFGDHAAGPMVQQDHGGDVHLGRGRPVAGMRAMSQQSYGAAAVLTGPGLPPPTWKGGPAALGLGPAWLGTRRAADVAERTFRSFLKPALQKGIQRLATFPQDHNLPMAPYKHRSASERM